MFGKNTKPGPIDSLIGTGTTIEGDITFTGGLRIDGHVKGNVRAGGNKKAAAKMLGLSRRALYRRLERLDLAATISRRRDVTLAEVSS